MVVQVMLGPQFILNNTTVHYSYSTLHYTTVHYNTLYAGGHGCLGPGLKSKMSSTRTPGTAHYTL